jgi:hypothetical protein
VAAESPRVHILHAPPAKSFPRCIAEPPTEPATEPTSVSGINAELVIKPAPMSGIDGKLVIKPAPMF